MFDNYLKNLASLKEEETIEAVVRHHWFTFMPSFIKIIILPLALFVLIYMFGFMSFLTLLNSVIFSYLALIIFLIWLAFSFYHWFIWYFDVGILTNQRIIVIDQKGLFEKSVSGAELDKIQDVTVNIKGLAPTLLGYGSLIAQTAGEMPNLIIKDTAHPAEIQRKILHLKNTKKEN